MTLKPPSFEEIIAHKKRRIAQSQVVTPLDSLRALARMQGRPQDVGSYIRDNRIALLARVMNPAARKLADPEAQENPYDPVMIARRLVRQGAQALMVSTDELYHGGSVSHLTLVANAVDVPVIRSDYILDEYQIVETRAAGADGLIIVPALLDADRLRSLISIAQRNLMTAIAKVHNEEELARVLPFEPGLIALDNRDQITGVLDFDTSSRLLEMVPGHISILVMGGLRSPHDVSRVMTGADGVLVNQDLLLAPDSAAAIRSLLGIKDRSGRRKPDLPPSSPPGL